MYTACPTGCDTCALDANNVVTCTALGCSAGWFYARDGQCIGQLSIYNNNNNNNNKHICGAP